MVLSSLLSCFRADPSIRLPIDGTRRKSSQSSITLGPASEAASDQPSSSRVILLREVCRRFGRQSGPSPPSRSIVKPVPEAISSPDYEIEGWSKTFMREQRSDWAASPITHSSQRQYAGPKEVPRAQSTYAEAALPCPFAISPDPFRHIDDLPAPSGKPFSTNDAVSQPPVPRVSRLSALFAAQESAGANPPSSAKTTAFEPEVDVFGEVVRTPPETIRVSRRASRAERRLSKEAAAQLSGPLPVVTSPPPLSPLPALPVHADEGHEPSVSTMRRMSTSSSTKIKTFMTSRHLRADSDLSQTSAVSSAGSAKGTYFNAYQPIAATSPCIAVVPMTPDSPASNTAPSSPGDVPSGPPSAARLLPSSSKPRPLSQDVRRLARGTRRAPARPETADGPCLILKDSAYRLGAPTRLTPGA